MHREPLPNPITLASLGTLAIVLHACPSVRPLVAQALIRSPCPTLLIKSCSISSHLASSLLASGCILFPLSGPIPAPITCLFTAWPFTISTRGTSDTPTGSHYWRLDTSRDGWHSWPIVHQWPQGPSTVDAAFSWDNKVYLIQVCVGREA